MATVAAPVQKQWTLADHLYRVTVAEYRRMAELGILTENHRIELLEGLLVTKMTRNPPHDGSLLATQTELLKVLPADWVLRVQSAITLADSEPEPDLTVARGPARRYFQAHPGPKDVAQVGEVADSSLVEDRTIKLRIYARARIPVYWIINLIDRCVEVYTQPRAGRNPAYRQRQVYGVTDTVPVVLAGKEVGRLAVRDLLP